MEAKFNFKINRNGNLSNITLTAEFPAYMYPIPTGLFKTLDEREVIEYGKAILKEKLLKAIMNAELEGQE